LNVAPSWWNVVHEVESEAVIFSFSDRPVQEKLGLWRERRNPNNGGIQVEFSVRTPSAEINRG
jgi:hypothetical protein